MTKLQSNCPICDADLELAYDIEETEIIACTECENRLVVESVDEDEVELDEAPEIDEDWGE